MGVDLLLFAVAMACVAAGVTVYCLVVEMSEAYEIAHHGWTRGHRHHRSSRPARYSARVVNRSG